MNNSSKIITHVRIIILQHHNNLTVRCTCIFQETDGSAVTREMERVWSQASTPGPGPAMRSDVRYAVLWACVLGILFLIDLESCHSIILSFAILNPRSRQDIRCAFYMADCWCLGPPRVRGGTRVVTR